MFLREYAIKHTHPVNGPFYGSIQVSRYQKGKTNLDYTEARDSEWQWHQLGHMQVCILLQTDNHTSTPRLCFLQAGCPSCRPTNSVKTLKAKSMLSSHAVVSHISCKSAVFKKIKELLIELWKTFNTSFKTCYFRVSMFHQVVQRH